MNKDDIKVKYLIGTFRDDPNYPSKEDFVYLIKNWYYNEGGYHLVHEYRRIPVVEGKILFPDAALVDKLNGDEKAAKSLLTSLLNEGFIQIDKKTKFTQYYTFI